ncbi:MAG: hypothetical protein IPM35_34040 [Myxococcales bacterium]|nr:hypothetical protein [Myxococcales bacterium]
MRLLLCLLAVSTFASCSSDDGGSEGSGGGGAGGSSSGGAAGTSGAAGSGGAPSDAGCVDFTACANCLTTACVPELQACDAVPACLQAQFDQKECFDKCLPASGCWSTLEVSAGSTAKALRACAKTACAVCQP